MERKLPPLVLNEIFNSLFTCYSKPILSSDIGEKLIVGLKRLANSKTRVDTDDESGIETIIEHQLERYLELSRFNIPEMFRDKQKHFIEILKEQLFTEAQRKRSEKVNRDFYSLSNYEMTLYKVIKQRINPDFKIEEINETKYNELKNNLIVDDYYEIWKSESLYY